MAFVVVVGIAALVSVVVVDGDSVVVQTEKHCRTPYVLETKVL